MKPSEMTNDQLAHNLEATVPFLMKEARHLTDADEIMREAARRLRKVTVRTDNSAVIAELQRRLKVAEDALEKAWMYASKLPHQWPLPERVRAKMKNALAQFGKETRNE